MAPTARNTDFRSMLNENENHTVISGRMGTTQHWKRTCSPFSWKKSRLQECSLAISREVLEIFSEVFIRMAFLNSKYLFRRNTCTYIYYFTSIFKRGNRVDYSNPKKQREYFDLFWKQVELRNFDDWYSVRYKDLAKFIGDISLSSIVKRYYGGSLSEAIKVLYPEHEWDDTRFRPRVVSTRSYLLILRLKDFGKIRTTRKSF